jgi:hypothetical protein
VRDIINDPPRESRLARWQRELALRFLLRGCRLSTAPQGWSCSPSPFVNGLSLLEPDDHARGAGLDPQRDIVVSTVRMGYGHHRIATGVCSYAGVFGRRALLQDLLSTSRDESRAVRRLNDAYSLLSRVSSDLGGPLEALWGRLMQSGGVGAQRLSMQLATSLVGLLEGLPRDVPFVSAYPLNGHLAVALGFRRVVNLVFDNDPQPFLVVPGALNLVQSSSSYQRLRMLGVPASEVAVGGHWVARELSDNVETDAEARIRRAVGKTPRRLLVTIGGAGAQGRLVLRLLTRLAPLLRAGEVRLLINLGDHAHLVEPFTRLVGELDVDAAWINSGPELDAFCAETPLSDHQDRALRPLTLFAFKDHMLAVHATDRLLRVVDVLVTKPSELAFVPVPKLHLRRVGDHEAASARRSVELGDGTHECRELDEAVRMTTLLTRGTDLIVPMNERILQNATQGVYSGAARAIEAAIATSSQRIAA